MCTTSKGEKEVIVRLPGSMVEMSVGNVSIFLDYFCRCYVLGYHQPYDLNTIPDRQLKL